MESGSGKHPGLQDGYKVLSIANIHEVRSVEMIKVEPTFRGLNLEVKLTAANIDRL